MTRVLVTGASGFIAKHIVRELLEQGFDVRGSVRSEKRADELRALFRTRRSSSSRSISPATRAGTMP